jgi:ribosomal protein S18 acetylase RimI-like enzyme
VSANEPVSFKVRRARRGDATPILALLADANLSCDSSTVNWIISHPEMEIFVAADTFDKALGFLTLSHRPMLKASGRTASVDELIVASAVRRRGVGRELLRHGVERARVLGVKRLQIEARHHEIEVALPFLKACGFETSALQVCHCHPSP